jgi:AbiV family abortive infection protein
VRGRPLYLRLAGAALQNAIDHFNDARALRKRGSRGHALSLSVLSIEEAAKAYLYKLAGEGVFRIVSGRPNGISTFSERQLLDHKFKHAIVARIVVQGLLYTPVYRVLSKTRAKTFTRDTVESMLGDLLHEQEMLQIRMRPGGPAAEAFSRIFKTLERADAGKNLGLYVGHRGGKILLPNDRSKSELDEMLGLAHATIQAVDQIVASRFSQENKDRAFKSVREVARAVKATKPESNETVSADSASSGSAAPSRTT